MAYIVNVIKSINPAKNMNSLTRRLEYYEYDKQYIKCCDYNNPYNIYKQKHMYINHIG